MVGAPERFGGRDAAARQIGGHLIYELARDLQTLLTARKFPVNVIHGPPRLGLPETFGAGSLEVHTQLDAQGGDDVGGAARGSKANPRQVGTRAIGVRALIYARSSLDGAGIGDHEKLCQALVDGVIVSLLHWASETKAVGFAFKSGKMISRDERVAEGSDTPPGAVYELVFSVPRGVYALTYEGEARPVTSGAITVTSATHAYRTGGDPDADPEVGCGG